MKNSTLSRHARNSCDVICADETHTHTLPDAHQLKQKLLNRKQKLNAQTQAIATYFVHWKTSDVNLADVLIIISLLFFWRSVSGKKLCSSCGQPLGKGAAMIIETLSLYFHIHCFKVGLKKKKYLCYILHHFLFIVDNFFFTKNQLILLVNSLRSNIILAILSSCWKNSPAVD